MEVCNTIRGVVTGTSWKPPQMGWCKLNADGMTSSLGWGGCGGVIRGDEGGWIQGFTMKLNTSNAHEAEAWGILKGLQLCWNMGIRKLEVESDAKNIVQLFAGNNQEEHCLNLGQAYG